jgi:hypothetical protein
VTRQAGLVRAIAKLAAIDKIADEAAAELLAYCRENDIKIIVADHEEPRIEEGKIYMPKFAFDALVRRTK